jgi:hypothetical protein
MPDQMASRSHYQLRLVKRVDRKRVVTHPPLAHAKSVNARDKTLDIFQANNDRAALQRAREYGLKSLQKKGPLPGDYRGVVVVKHQTAHAKPFLVEQTKSGAIEIVNRRRRLAGSTVWLYYLDNEGNAWNLDAKSHELRGSVAHSRQA